MKARSCIALLLGLLLAAQPAFAASQPRCAHHGDQPHAGAMAHHGHHGMRGAAHGAMHDDGQSDAPSKSCDCGCLGAMAGCAHAGASVAISGRLAILMRTVRADAPVPARDAARPSASSDPPLRPPTFA